MGMQVTQQTAMLQDLRQALQEERDDRQRFQQEFERKQSETLEEVETLKDHCNRKFMTLSKTLESRGHSCQDELNAEDMHPTVNDINSRLIDIRNEILAETMHRERDTEALCEMMAKESTEREKDEAAIVDSIQKLMELMGQNHQVQVQEWVESAPEGPEKDFRRAKFLESMEPTRLESPIETPRTDQLENPTDIFKNLDSDDGGMIEPEGLLNVLNRLDGNRWTQARLNTMLKASGMAENSDGKINLDSFIQYLFGM